MKVIDPGHSYELLTLDGDISQKLTFVKRHDDSNPARFPCNLNSHPGTTLQSVIRVLIDRVCYLQSQIPCDENIAIINNLRNSLYLLEHRAMRRHGLDASSLTQEGAQLDPMCPECGHTRCIHLPTVISEQEHRIAELEREKDSILADLNNAYGQDESTPY